MWKTFSLSMSMVTAAAIVALAQAPKPVTIEHSETGTATIVSIDQATRSVTLRYMNGDEDTFTVGPEVKRFDQLKRGDTIRATYMAAVVFEVRKPGAPDPGTATAVAGARVKDTPGAALGTMQKATVTVKAVDAAKGTITVTAADGRTMHRVVQHKENLTGVKVGDKIDITYAQAVLLNAEPGK